MSLVLHCGAEECSPDKLRQVIPPEATQSHVPIPHHRLVDIVRHTLSYYGHEVTEEHHGITEDGMRYFGVMKLRSQYGWYEDSIGLCNSNDKRFPIGILFGSQVFVCDNMAFQADPVIGLQTEPTTAGTVATPLKAKGDCHAHTHPPPW